MPISEPLTDFQVAIDQQHRVIPIDGVINFRDLGGYQTRDGNKVRYGSVFRSAQLSGLTSQGVQQAASLGIKSIIDLRFDDEISRYPTVKGAFPLAEIVSWQDLQPISDSDLVEPKPGVGKGSWRESLDSNDPNRVREAMRINYPQKLYSHKHIYRDMLVRITKGNSPLLFHCAAGKDRTGVAAALILSLVGVSDDLLVEDYLVTAQTTKGLLESFHAAGAAADENQQDFHSKLASYPKHVIQPVFDTDPEYIGTLISYVNQKYGGFRAYAAEVLNLDEGFFRQLEEALLA